MQVAADAWTVLHDVDPQGCELCLGSDPRTQQDCRRIEGSSSEDDLVSAQLAVFSISAVAHTDGPPVFDDDGVHVAACSDVELVAHGFEVGRPCIGATSVDHRDLLLGDPVEVVAVAVRVALKAFLHGGIDHGLLDR